MPSLHVRSILYRRALRKATRIVLRKRTNLNLINLNLQREILFFVNFLLFLKEANFCSFIRFYDLFKLD